MQYLENISDNDDLLNKNELSLETPIGWSSMCFDQTIDYYMECNSINSNSEKGIENINNKDLM